MLKLIMGTQNKGVEPPLGYIDLEMAARERETQLQRELSANFQEKNRFQDSQYELFHPDISNLVQYLTQIVFMETEVESYHKARNAYMLGIVLVRKLGPATEVETMVRDYLGTEVQGVHDRLRTETDSYLRDRSSIAEIIGVQRYKIDEDTRSRAPVRMIAGLVCMLVDKQRYEAFITKSSNSVEKEISYFLRKPKGNENESNSTSNE